MKEVRYFYVPNADSITELPDDEALHALRVLRLKEGDKMMLMDGVGNFYCAEVTLAAHRKCMYKITDTIPQKPQWAGKLGIAIAPTKMMERMEWMVEKATEIGIDEISFLDCQFSERKVIKTDRLEKIVVSAVKQSRKAWKPQLNHIEAFKEFVNCPRQGKKFIAHCYNEIPRKFIFDELSNVDPADEVTVRIGPEGDFSIDEVKTAIDCGYTSIHLGQSRYRTETAALCALMMMQLSK